MAEPIPSLITTGLVVVSVIFPLLSLASIVLRFKARRLTKLQLQADDWLILATWILSIALSINVWVYASIIGINFYTTDALSGAVYSAVCLVLASIFTQIALTTVKISLLLFYRRVFDIYVFRIVVWIAVAFVLLWGIAMILIVALQGDSREFVLTEAAGGTYVWRLDPTIVGYTQVGSSLVLDVIILCFPLPVISRLHMPTRRKILVGGIFWLGIFCCITVAVRLALVHKVLTEVLSTGTAVSLQALQFIFLIIEPHASMVAACLPCYGPLLHGRTPESLVRSVRSIISIGSRGSSNSKSRSAVRLPSNNDSQREINLEEANARWPPNQDTAKVHVSAVRKTDKRDEIELEDLAGGINVTKGVNVVRSGN